MVSIQCLGTGDAFGSGGRLNACYLVQSSNLHLLVDCGASSLIALKRFNIDPGVIDLIIISHLHGDHFAGIPFVIRESQVVARRTKPLTIIGPIGTEARINEALQVLFPSPKPLATSFSLTYHELPPGITFQWSGISIETFHAVHSFGTNPLSLRITIEEKIIGYTGDTEWNENVPKVAEGTDVFLCEGYTLEREMRNHLNIQHLISSSITTKRIVLVHMREEVLIDQNVPFEKAFDGMTLSL